jgi:hypothetical protein
MPVSLSARIAGSNLRGANGVPVWHWYSSNQGPELDKVNRFNADLRGSFAERSRASTRPGAGVFRGFSNPRRSAISPFN